MRKAAPPTSWCCPGLDVQASITDPPFKLATQFVRHALDLCTRCDGPLARIWLFRNRLPHMHRDGWDGPKASSVMAFAWLGCSSACIAARRSLAGLQRSHGSAERSKRMKTLDDLGSEIQVLVKDLAKNSVQPGLNLRAALTRANSTRYRPTCCANLCAPQCRHLPHEQLEILKAAEECEREQLAMFAKGATS
jgi:hypothetical protein